MEVFLCDNGNMSLCQVCPGGGREAGDDVRRGSHYFLTSDHDRTASARSIGWSLGVTHRGH
eukprot:1938979-Prymnesium_polylepis.1